MSLYEEHDFACPYCGAANFLSIDATGGRRQQFVVDCETCCSPILVRLTLEGGALASIDIRRENE